MTNHDLDGDWDLSGLLDSIDPPADGLERLYRHARRRRRARIIGAVTAAIVIAVAAVSVGLSVPKSGRVNHVNVTDGGPITAVLHVPPAPAGAAKGATALDTNGIRVWLPPSWKPHGTTCPTEGAVGGLASGDLTFAPCSRRTKTAQLTIAPAGAVPSSAIATRINGIDVTVSHPAHQPRVEVVNVASLNARLTGTTPAAQAIIATLQPSAAADILAGPAHLAVPAGWRQVTYAGVTFDAPPTWPRRSTAVASCHGLGYGGPVVDLGLPTSVSGCAAGIGINPRAYDGVLIGRGSETFPPGALKTVRHDGAITVTANDTSDVPQFSEPPAITANLRTPHQTLLLELDVGPDPSIAATILGSIRAAGTASTATTAGAAAPEVAGGLPAALSAQPLAASLPNAGRQYLAPGTAVPAADVAARVRATAQISYGLAELTSSKWPVISTDGGRQWHIDGPLFSYPAAQGANTVDVVGTGDGTADFAYAWGHGGNFVKTTYDAGRHWSETDFPDGIDNVTLIGGTMQVQALGPQSSTGQSETFLYLSSDQGRHWTRRGQPNDTNH